MRDARNQGAQLRESVRLQQLALQQHLPGDVHGQEQQLGGAATRIHVGDDAFHLRHLVPAHLDAEPHLLRLLDAVAQRGEEPGALGWGRPLRQVATAQRAGVGRG